jgi:hypothetical protein
METFCGKGAIRHREFAMASGEMTEAEFVSFLSRALGFLGRHSQAGSVHFICMDWRHAGELLTAGKQTYNTLLNLCVWAKDNGGMGSLYRSQHELVFVFRKGLESHRNNRGMQLIRALNSFLLERGIRFCSGSRFPFDRVIFAPRTCPGVKYIGYVLQFRSKFRNITHQHAF